MNKAIPGILLGLLFVLIMWLYLYLDRQDMKKNYEQGLHDGANIVLDEVIRKCKNGTYDIDGYSVVAKIDSLVKNY